MIQTFDPIEKIGHDITIGQLKEHLFGVKQEAKKVPKKTDKKDEK